MADSLKQPSVSSVPPGPTLPESAGLGDCPDSIEKFASDFEYYVMDTDRLVLTVGFGMSLYYWSGHTPEKREALVECVEAFEAAYGQHLKWGRNPKTWKATPYPGKKLPSFRDYMSSVPHDDAAQWYTGSGEDKDAACDYSVLCIANYSWMPHAMSFLHLHVPRALVFDEAELAALLKLFNFAIDRLRPEHARAGWTVITPEQHLEWEAEEFDVARRYLGLHVGESNEAAHAFKGFKSIDWLTYVSDIQTTKLGGPMPFVKYCAARDVLPERLPAGFLVKAGDMPRLAPVSEPPPEAYVRVNTALRPLRDGNFGSMGAASFRGGKQFDRCTTDLWTRRFDVSGTWPPATFVGLPKTPLGTPPRKHLKLKTGAVCTVHGRYRCPGFSDEVPEHVPKVVLLPGDQAPAFPKFSLHGEYLGTVDVAWELEAEL